MLKLYTPGIDELSYREKLLNDIDTMEYNKGYDLGIDNYDIKTGCIAFTSDYYSDWYNRWINKKDRFYAYLLDEEINEYVGEVSFRYDSKLDGYMVGIIIESGYRGKGYSRKGLKLLIDKAFYDYGASVLYDDIPSSRVNAIKLFESEGFVKEKTYFQKKFDKDEEVYLMKLNRKG